MTTLAELQQEIGIAFKQEKLLLLAMTHRSFSKKILKSNFEDNERLEYLGDAVLKLIVSEHLYVLYPNEREGVLTKLRSKMIGDCFLSVLAKHYNLGAYMRFSYGEKKNGGDLRPSNLANAFEALLGAIYLDQGLAVVSNFFIACADRFADVLAETADYKSQLQEQLQKFACPLPIYSLFKESGPDHQKEFEIKLSIVYKGRALSVVALGASKKEAEQLAAKDILAKL